MSRQLNRDAGARCSRCGSSFGHLRGCSLEDLTLLPTQETNLRHNPEDVSAFDVDCLLHEIDRLREEQSKHWVAANEENVQKAGGAMSISIICEWCENSNEQTHAACTCSCHLYRKEIARLQTELAESQWLWKVSLEAQGELEKTVARQAATIQARQQSWHQLKQDRDDWMNRVEFVEKELGEVKQLLAACRALRSIEHRIAGHNREDEELQS